MSTETYQTIIERIARRKSSPLEVFRDFCRMVACALANETREEEYFAAIQGYSKDELSLLSKAMGLLVEEMQRHPFTDLLGTYYTEIGSRSGQKDRGEFYTPQPVSQMMAQMTIDPKAIIERGLPITVNEPACGAGGMVLAIAELFAPQADDDGKIGQSHVDLLRVTCQDINPLAVDMCFINTTLWGIPAHMIQGNVLTCEFVNTYKNIHWLRVGEDHRQAFNAIMQIVAEPQKPNHQKQDQEPIPEPIQGSQVEFDFDLGQAMSAPTP